MSDIALLVRLQAQQALGGLRDAMGRRTGWHIAVAATVLLGAVVMGGLAYLGYAAHGILGALGMETTLYNLLFLACGALTFTFSIPIVLGSFFGSSDTGDLLSLPVTPRAIVLSKALAALASSYLWTFLLIVGPLLGWGIAAGPGLGFWVTFVLAAILTPLMPTAYAGTLSLLIATAFKRVRRKDAITTITTVLTLAMALVTYLALSSARLSDAAQALGELGAGMGGALIAFPAYGFAVRALAHPDPLAALLFALISVGAFLVFVGVARALYLRVVTSLSSGGGRSGEHDVASVRGSSAILPSLLRLEVRKVVRNSSIFLNYVIYPLVIMPIMLGVMQTTGGIGDLLRDVGREEDGSGALIVSIILALIMLLASACTLGNRVSETAISREGSNWSTMRYIPVATSTQLVGKVLPGFFVSALVSLLFMGWGGFQLVARAGASPVPVVSCLVLLLGANWLTAWLGIWSDSRHPRLTWGNDGDVNVGALRGAGAMLGSLLVGAAYSLLPLLASPLTGLDQVVFMPLVALVGTIVAVLLGRVACAAAARNVETYE